MGKQIPVTVNPSHDVAIDGGVVARALGLDVSEFRRLMDDRKISVLCERGTGDDAGLYRATFYHDGKRARLVVDAEGQVVGPVDA